MFLFLQFEGVVCLKNHTWIISGDQKVLPSRSVCAFSYYGSWWAYLIISEARSWVLFRTHMRAFCHKIIINIKILMHVLSK